VNTAIVVLGSPNDEKGKLLPIAISRCEQALLEFKKHPTAKVLCTGGFGLHFNQTNLPHGHYCQQYLQSKGISAQHFLPITLSAFTLEDASLSLAILQKHQINKVILVTSDFHIERSKFVFNHFMPEIHFEYAPAKTISSKTEQDKLILHEKKALLREQKNLSCLS